MKHKIGDTVELEIKTVKEKPTFRLNFYKWLEGFQSGVIKNI